MANKRYTLIIKKLRTLLFPLLFLLLLLLTPSTTQAKKSFSIDKVDIDITLNKDGSAHVKERRTYDFNGVLPMLTTTSRQT